MPTRCPWPSDHALMIRYHDEEWGVPLHGDEPLFAKLILDGFQAGLSWRVILDKREGFLEAFDGFDPERMARFDARRRAKLLRNPGIVRNRAKIRAAIENARAYLRLRDEVDSFDTFLWSFVEHTPRQPGRKSSRGIPAKTRESERMSAALLERGFKFVGPTICYAFMQAVGMVNDHLITCFRHREVRRLA
jgi:DNA-3-methyladenine glycosylase I